MLELRPASKQDWSMLLHWRNDPLTRAMSVTDEPVSLEEHATWMLARVLGDNVDHVVLIGYENDEPIGVVRFDVETYDELSYRVSLTIAPEQRGKGYGKRVLRRGCEFMRDFGLNAEIKDDNPASAKAFGCCGFKLVTKGEQFHFYRKEAS